MFANFGKFSSNFFEKCDFRAVQRSALCRSRRELSNAYLLGKFGFDTAENEPRQDCCLMRARSHAPQLTAQFNTDMYHASYAQWSRRCSPKPVVLSAHLKDPPL